MYPAGNPYPGVYPGVYQPYPGGPGQTGMPQNQPNGQTSGYICRPVTSREEAVAAQVEFQGPGTIMPDFSHGMIYFKRFNTNTGFAEFFDFAVQPLPQAQAQPPAPTPPAGPAYDPRGDIEALRGDLTTLRGELEDLKKTGQKRPVGKAAE